MSHGRLVYRWDKRVTATTPQGTEVLLVEDDGTILHTVTTSAPWTLPYGMTLVRVDCKVAGYDVTRMRLWI